MTFASAAHLHQSSFLGFVACVGLFSSLGFVVIPFTLGVSVGFSDIDVTRRCAATSFTFLVFTLVVTKAFPPHWRAVMMPFQFGLFTMGAVVYFLALLILSSGMYISANTPGMYWVWQLLFVLPLFGFFSIGTIYDVSALTNTAGVFAVLYAMDKYVELARSSSKNLFWVFVFFGGVMMLSSGFYLQTHPAIITALFQVKPIF